MPKRDITATGIPIHPVFSQPKGRVECLERLGLKGDRPVVLQLSGGFGVGPIEKLFRALLDVDEPLEIMVVTGRNQKVKTQLEKVKLPSRHNVKIFGFTDKIDELMAAADLVLSKPGGLTTSETLARGAAMVIVNPIPGQETRNSDFLLESGAAIKVNNIATLAHKGEEMGFGILAVSDHIIVPTRVQSTHPYSASGQFDVGGEAQGA